MILVMKKKSIGATLLFLSLLSMRVFAAETQDTSNTQLKEQMRGLEEDFKGLEDPLGKKPPDYDRILKLLDDMTTHATAVQSLKSSGHPGKAFKRLFTDIESFKKAAKAKNASGVQDDMNRLAENCFRCHLSH